VDVAADILGDPVKPADQRVGAILDQFGFTAEAEKQRVEQGEAFGIAAEDGAAG